MTTTADTLRTAAGDAANPATAVAKRDNTPAGMVRQYRSDFIQVMPTHVKPDAWVRIAAGALKKGKKVTDGTGRTELEVAAANNVGVFMAALLDAARLGLEPGTEQYYLTPRKVKGQLEILGIVGYQGIIELMYRGGAVASVVAECVHSNDTFTYQPGRDDLPRHEIDWDADDRGELRLVYAYARMRDGAVSKVVVLNRTAINTIKRSSAGADYDTSPWKTNAPAMWLKSAVRQLGKWVPTSAEYRDTFVNAPKLAVDTLNGQGRRPAADPLPGDGSVPDYRSIGDVLDAEVVDGAEVEDPPAGVDTSTGEVTAAGTGEWPATAKPGSKAAG